MTKPFRLDVSISELREEFAQNGLSGRLWPWAHERLTEYVRARMFCYRAAIYSPTGEWDTGGVSDLVNDFLVDKGIEGDAIGRGLLMAGNTVGFVRYLESALRNHAVSQRRRTVASNIFQRLGEVLASDARLFRFSQAGLRDVYGLADWKEEARESLSDDQLSNAMRFLPEGIEWIEYGKGNRLSPGISSDALSDIAQRVIRGTGRAVTAGQIMRLIRDRYGLVEDVPVGDDIDDMYGLRAPGLNPLEEAFASDIALRAVRGMNALQQDVLRLWLSQVPPLSVRAIGDELGISKSQVSQRQQEISEMFRRLNVVGHDERRQVLEVAAALLGRREAG